MNNAGFMGFVLQTIFGEKLIKTDSRSLNVAAVEASEYEFAEWPE